MLHQDLRAHKHTCALRSAHKHKGALPRAHKHMRVQLRRNRKALTGKHQARDPDNCFSADERRQRQELARASKGEPMQF